MCKKTTIKVTTLPHITEVNDKFSGSMPPTDRLNRYGGSYGGRFHARALLEAIMFISTNPTYYSSFIIDNPRLNISVYMTEESSIMCYILYNNRVLDIYYGNRPLKVSDDVLSDDYVHFTKSIMRLVNDNIKNIKAKEEENKHFTVDCSDFIISDELVEHLLKYRTARIDSVWYDKPVTFEVKLNTVDTCFDELIYAISVGINTSYVAITDNATTRKNIKSTIAMLLKVDYISIYS